MLGAWVCQVYYCPNYAPSLCSVAGLLLALALQSRYEDATPLLRRIVTAAALRAANEGAAAATTAGRRPTLSARGFARRADSVILSGRAAGRREAECLRQRHRRRLLYARHRRGRVLEWLVE